MIHVSPQDIPKHWEFVERGLQRIIRKTGEKWNPLHILQALVMGKAALFVCDEGFAVLEKGPAQWTGEPYLHVWALWFKPHTARARKQELLETLDRITSESGCSYWEFASPRGWDKEGFEKVTTIWRRKT